MGNYFSKRRRKRVRDTDASSPTISKKRRIGKSVELQSEQCESESPFLLPSSDSLEKIDVPSASGANSDPPASSSSDNGNNYYVFLSFRGPDTRKGFVDYLYQRLKAVGLRCHTNPVFRDDEDLPFGENIGENLINAIERSKVSIPVISENYADSEWCLRELIHIMKCKESRGQIVLPVLYKVKPKHVRKLKGAFGKAFKSSMHLFEEDVKQQGPEALRKAVACRIFDSTEFANGHEGELVEKLVREIMHKKQRDFLPPLPRNLVGVDDHVAEVMKLVDTDPSKTRTVTIHGMGGIGKTTLATVVYRKIFDKFECHSFIRETREIIRRDGIERVQSLLISDITGDPVCRVRDSNIGIEMIQSICENKKVLILLDGVDCPKDLDNLIGGCNFKSGSRLIITSRHNALSEYRYELKEMNSKDSWLLFNKHAFEGEQPSTEVMAISRDIVATTGGHPLAIEVIGSFLKGKENNIWMETLEKLRKMPHEDVQRMLKISYDLLDPGQKQIFLDIACFFTGRDKRVATYMWKDLQLYPNSGLARLRELSLIGLDDNRELRMHEQLRDLGRAIVLEESDKPWKRSRLWNKEDIMEVLRRKKENEIIEELRLDKMGSKMFMEQKSYKRMPNLKFLHISDVEFHGDFKDSFSQLRFLQWTRCPDSFKATNLHLAKLLTFNLSYSDISENWGGWSSIKMEGLKVLDLSWCLHLKSTPNLSTFNRLEMLILEGCGDLEEIDPSIGDVRCLTSLNLRYCVKLKKLPSQLGELKGLVVLDLWECVKLQELPEEIGKLEALEELIIGGTAIKKIPPCVGFLKKLEKIKVCHCK